MENSKDRPVTALLNKKDIKIPRMVMSVSSVETHHLSPAQYTEVLTRFGFDPILVSAYDIFHSEGAERQKFLESIHKAMSLGLRVIMDSGKYEKSRYKDNNWTRDKFYEVAKMANCDLYFSFDNQTPPNNPIAIAEDIINNFREDEAAILKPGRVQPIVHANDYGHFPEACFLVAKVLKPEFIAVAERDLGCGIFNRAKTLKSIRDRLNELGYYQPIHVLGTGNPMSMAILAAAGGDLFDGLEWCRTSVDHETARLHHTQQYDFFSWQTDYRSDDDQEHIVKILFHNLEFFYKWNEEFAAAVESRQVWEWLLDKKYLTSSIVADARSYIGI